MSEVLTVILSHQPEGEVARVLAKWAEVTDPSALLLAYGGTEQNFASIRFAPKSFIGDSDLRSKDQQRGRQSWKGVLKAASAHLQKHPEFSYVHLVEFDHLPLVSNIYTHLLERISAEQADVLAHQLHRIDDTSHPHFLYHQADRRFAPHFEAISCRADKRTILTMLGTGSFWTRGAFEAVASRPEPFPIYVELYLPSLSHHLGYRVRGMAEQDRFVRHQSKFLPSLAECRAAGAWAIHPRKTIPEDGVLK